MGPLIYRGFFTPTSNAMSSPISFPLLLFLTFCRLLVAVLYPMLRTFRLLSSVFVSFYIYCFYGDKLYSITVKRRTDTVKRTEIKLFRLLNGLSQTIFQHCLRSDRNVYDRVNEV